MCSLGLIATVEGNDRDYLETCDGRLPCPCSEMHYSIVSGNENNYFEMNSATGAIFLNPEHQWKDETEYILRVLVSSNSVNINMTDYNYQNIQVVLTVFKY